MDGSAVAELLTRQHGLISRRQALSLGLDATAIKRQLRRREWFPVHPGVYVGHNGPLSWEQRAWAAVLACAPAVLSHQSALRAQLGPTRGVSEDVIHLSVDRGRRLSCPDGVRLHRTDHLATRAQWDLDPPRVRYDEAVLDLACAAGHDLDAIAVLADACGSRRTTANRLRVRLAHRARVRRRSWLDAVLHDLAQGTCSVLEHGYLHRVERAHALPTGIRQRAHRGPGGTRYSDVEYDALALVVELDGRLFHDSAAARNRDLVRDLQAAVERDSVTVRLGYDQVYADPCRTAASLARLMQRRGWTGRPGECTDCGGSGQPG